MAENKPEPKKKVVQADGETAEPVHTIQEGAVAASIMRRQSLSGYAYYDFSLSRSWKSMSSNKTGYSKNFFACNGDEVKRVVEKACDWIMQHESTAIAGTNGKVSEGEHATST